MMNRWTVLIVAAAAVVRAGSAQTAADILQKVAAAYRGGAPLDIESVEGYDHQSPAVKSTTQTPTRMVQSGSKARLEQGGMLFISDGVRNWQYSSGFNEYAQTREGMSNRFTPFMRITDQIQSARILCEESLTLQGASVPCYASTFPTAPDVPGGTTQRVMQVTRVATGEGVPDSLFQFTPPAGAKLVDRINSTPQSPYSASLSRNSSGPICRVIHSLPRACPGT
jgi:outer membrane lipoprotein-sorting protein